MAVFLHALSSSSLSFHDMTKISQTCTMVVVVMIVVVVVVMMVVVVVLVMMVSHDA